MIDTYLYCSVLLENHTTSLWYIADYKAQKGDFVLAPLGENNTVKIGYILETRFSDCAHAPYSTIHTKHIIKNYEGEHEFSTAKNKLEKSLCKILPKKEHEDKLVIKEQLAQRMILKASHERTERNKNEFFNRIQTSRFTVDTSIKNYNDVLNADIYIPVGVFRGIACEVNKAIKYIDTVSDRVTSKRLVDDGIYEFVIRDQDVIKNIIVNFPNLKATLFLECFFAGEIETAYSRSGYPYITDKCFAGVCDFHSEIRWTHEHLPTEPEFRCTVEWIHCDENDEVKYRFKYKDEWDSMNYVFEKDGITQQILSIDEKDASDYIVEDIGDGYGKIIGYRGDNIVLNLPQEVDGLKIIAIDRQINRYLEKYEKINHLIVPEGYISVGGFSNLNNLETVVLPYSLKQILSKAFKNCKKLSSVDIKDYVTDIYNEAFAECPKLEVFELPAQLKNGNAEKILCPDYDYDEVFSYGYGDDKLGKCLFQNSGIKKLFVKSSTIDPAGSDCLKGCDNYIIYAPKGSPFFTDKNYSNNTTKWNYRPHGNPSASKSNKQVEAQKSVSDVLIFNEAEYINDVTFYNINKRNINTIFIGENVERIYEESFAKFKNLTNIKFSFGTEKIEQNAFRNCSKLQSVELSDSISTLGGKAFFNCYSLNEVYLSKSLKRINKYTFYNCNSLKNIIVPNAVTIIDDYSFTGCSSLNDITIPQTLKKIGSCAFKDCHSLENIDIPKSVGNIGDSAFYNCKALKEISLISKVKSIEHETFFGCCNLQNIKLPECLKTIEWAAFEECSSLLEITIPKSVQTIVRNAFKSCSNLNKITILGKDTTIGSDVFLGVNDVTIYAPSGSYAEEYAKENRIKFEKL